MFIFNNFFTRIIIFFKFRLIGEDEFGNRYYEHLSQKNNSGFNKRWCLFKGVTEPSKVPALFHSWLHYSSHDISIFTNSPVRFFWQKSHLPNLSGTSYSYSPFKDIKKRQVFYKAWKPKKLDN